MSTKCNNADYISFLHVNCRSLNKNFSELLALLKLIDIPVTAIAVTETWLKHSSHDCYNIHGYNCIFNSRLTKNGGGVGIYLSDTLDFNIRNDLNLMLPDIESVFIEVHRHADVNLLFGSIYRPPNSNFTNFYNELSSLLRIVDKEKRRNFF